MSVRAAATSCLTRRNFLRSLLFTATSTSVTASRSTIADADANAADVVSPTPVATATTNTLVSSSYRPSDAHHPSSMQEPSDPDVVAVACAADLLQANCEPFIHAISPLSPDILLYRGHPLPSPPLRALTPLRLMLDVSPGDLFDADTYGVDDRAAVSFFRALDAHLATLAAQQSLTSGSRRRRSDDDGNTGIDEDSTRRRSRSRSRSLSCDVPRVGGAHIGTGSCEDAAQWGVPMTVWPIGSNVRFAVWDNTNTTTPSPPPPTTTTNTTAAAASSITYTSTTNATHLSTTNDDRLHMDDNNNDNVIIRHNDPRRFIYARGDTFQTALAAKRSLAFDRDSLRAALARGHEVLFQCAAFYVMPQQLVAPVLRTLAGRGVSVENR